MIEAIRELMHRLPFEPFNVVTASGDKYPVTNPDEIAVGKDTIFVYTRDGNFTFVRNNQITSVESIRTAA